MTWSAARQWLADHRMDITVWLVAICVPPLLMAAVVAWALQDWSGTLLGALAGLLLVGWKWLQLSIYPERRRP